MVVAALVFNTYFINDLLKINLNNPKTKKKLIFSLKKKLGDIFKIYRHFILFYYVI